MSTFGKTLVLASGLAFTVTALADTPFSNPVTSSDPRHNTAGGTEALSAVEASAGMNNTAFGYQALKNHTGHQNTAVGTSALTANTTGGSNIAVGTGALGVNTTGGGNLAIGAYALAAN